MLVASHLAKFREDEGVREEPVSFGLGLGSILAVVPLLDRRAVPPLGGRQPSLSDEIALLTVTILMTVTGVAWQIKATTLWGGVALVLYLIVLVASLAYHPQVAIGVYLAVGGAAVFASGHRAEHVPREAAGAARARGEARRRVSHPQLAIAAKRLIAVTALGATDVCGPLARRMAD